MIIDWLAPFPYTLRSSEIRDAAAGGNAGPGEHEDIPSSPKQLNQFLAVCVHKEILTRMTAATNKKPAGSAKC
jgi:hypothetical protein